MKHTRTTVVKDTIELKEADKILAVKQGKLYFFVSRKEYQTIQKKHPKWDPVTIVEKVKRQYFYRYPSQDKMFREAFASGTELMFDALKKCWDNMKRNSRHYIL